MQTYFVSDLVDVNQGLVRENVPQSSELASENFFGEIMWQVKGMEQNKLKL